MTLKSNLCVGYGYQNANSNLKNDMRNVLLRRVVEHFDTRQLSTFTLPSDNFVFEKVLHEQYGKKLSMVGVEQDDVVFKKANKILNAHGLPMDLHHQTDLDYWKSSDEEFNFVWLDYCGGWSPGKQESFQILSTGNHLRFSRKSNPLVGVTLMNAMDLMCINELITITSKGKNRNKWDDPSMKFKARLVGIPSQINAWANQNKHTFVPLNIYYYKDSVRNKRSRPMIMFLFEVVKGVKKLDLWNTPVTKSTHNSVYDL